MDTAGQDVKDLLARALGALTELDLLLQFGLVAGLLAIVFLLRARLRGSDEGWRAALRQRLAVPAAVAVAAGLAALALLSLGRPYRLLHLVAALALSLLLIRLLVHGLERLLRPAPALRAFEHVISGVAWSVVALVQLDWMRAVLDALDGFALTLGEGRVSVLDALKGFLVVASLLLAAAFAATLIERRLIAASQVSISVRVGLAKFSRYLLLLLALLVGLNAIGIDLTTLTVFSGALGVGLGFGLQRIASNFISGFILIVDRSIRQGDVISVGDTFGWVKELRARYVVVCNRDGVEMLIPNENLITTEVVNWSYSDRNVRIKVPVQVSYDDDPEAAMALLVAAAEAHPRVQAEPAPVARLMAFGDSGIDLELRVWISDPEDGVNNIRSELYVDTWKRFKAAGITIPYPQRDLHWKSPAAPWSELAARVAALEGRQAVPEPPGAE